MYILTLLKANLKYKKGSFISILILILIISTLTTSVISIKNNMRSRINKANDTVGSGDLVIYIENKILTEDMLSKTKSCDSVKDVQVKPVMMMHNTRIKGQEISCNIFLQSFTNDQYPYEVFNEATNNFLKDKIQLKENEILLPISMGTNYSCDIGDSVSFDFGVEKKDFTIAGFIEEPMAGSNVMGVKFPVISDAAYQHIRDITGIEEAPDNEYIWDGTLVHVYVTDTYKDNVEAVSKEINKACNIVSLGFTSMTKEQTITYTLLVTEIICGTLDSFIIILFVVVILVLSNNINSNIEMDYENIGILKSQGFTKYQIRLILLIQYLLSGVLGTLLGFLLALPLVHFLRNLFISTSGLLFSNGLNVLNSIGILSLILLSMALFILYKTRKVSRISPVNAISGGIDNVYFSSVIQTPVVGRSKRFLNLKLAFRQLTTDSKWYIGTCLIIALLVAFVCLSASFKETFTERYYNELFGVVQSDVEVEYEDGLKKQPNIESIIASVSPIKEKFHSGEQYLLIDNEQNLAQVLDDASYLKCILEGRAPKYDNEIVITNLLRDSLGKDIGDTVEIQIKETKKEYIITGIYDSCADTGRCLSITLDGMYRVMPDYEVTRYEYFLENAELASAAIQAVYDAYPNDSTFKTRKPTSMNPNAIDAIMLSTNVVILCIILISMIFAIIVICMICNKMYLKEKHTLGIYKAFGFTSSNIRFQYCFRFLFVAILGSIVGGITFILFGNDLNSGILELAGISSYYAPITLFNLGFPILLICVTVFVSSFITMKKVKKVDVKSLIVE